MMISIFKSELLKIKSTTVSRIWWMAPVILMVLSYFLTSSYCVIDNFNWYYTTIFPFGLTLSCVLITKQEKNKKYRGILPIPIDGRKIIYGKILVLTFGTFLSLLIVCLGSSCLQWILGSVNIQKLPYLNMLLAVFILSITFMWQIPLILFSGFKFGFFPTLIINIVLQMGFGIVASLEDWWIISPYSYPARLMIPLLKILPNGLPAVAGSETYKEELLSYKGSIVAVLISVIIFIIGSVVVGKWMEKREAV
ncbi:lantibiotic immunity ABC transporter MutE/EpiE family permease subunit [Anaerosacchariphilus polymeriproducens]|uniref:Lantibiotic immunity ABC transporter MutE/EpiE family permease subunit n=1 Tax=Anaerosacchariphilus polymeriproducens TaxID=1812858 RepID=A0A371AXL2_9FIRM|nr:lantibiotic immunity ABC transporter MutE/EpiE family permease subunit [Anaerosacchariphilus polymeriproducens]RDU24220.1 lantibiotic immunity ABC transporter MutE/EpiE family permease subunit [Anaerosacchariphilus polymeriproducens]